MFGAYVLFVVSLTGSSVRVLGQDDLVLTCPQKWVLNASVTLYCEVSKSSITSKCTNTQDNTFFTQDGTTPRCTVGSADYTTCNFDTPSSTGCGCRQNTTHYTFVYHISEVGNNDGGDWTCDKACTDSSGLQNPLTKYINPTCIDAIIITPHDPYDCTVARVLTAVAQVVFVAACVVAIVCVIKDTPKKDSWERKAVVLGFVLAVALTVAFMAVAISMACTHKDDCDPLCVVAIILLVIDVIVVVIIAVITIVKCKPKRVNKPL